eukprot:g77522.t1
MDQLEIDREVNCAFVFLKRRWLAIFGTLVTCMVMALLGTYAWDLNHIEKYQDSTFYISSFRFSASVESKPSFNSTWNVAACQEMLTGYNYDPGSIRITSVVSKAEAGGSASGKGTCDFRLNVTNVNDIAKVFLHQHTCISVYIWSLYSCMSMHSY